MHPGRLPVPLDGGHRDDRPAVRAPGRRRREPARRDVRPRRVGRWARAARAGARPRRGEAAVLDRDRWRAAVRLRDPGATRLPRPGAARERHGGGPLCGARLRPRPAHHVRRHRKAPARARALGGPHGRHAPQLLAGRRRRGATLPPRRRRDGAHGLAPRGGARADVGRAGGRLHERRARLLVPRRCGGAGQGGRADPHLLGSVHRAGLRREPARRGGDPSHPHHPSRRHGGRRRARARVRRGHGRARRARGRPRDPADVPPRRRRPRARQSRALGRGRGRAVRRLPDVSRSQGGGMVPPDPGPEPRAGGREPPAQLDRQGDPRVHVEAVRRGSGAVAAGAAAHVVRRARARRGRGRVGDGPAGRVSGGPPSVAEPPVVARLRFLPARQPAGEGGPRHHAGLDRGAGAVPRS